MLPYRLTMQGYINALYSRDKHERRIGKRLEKILREWVNEYNQTKNIDEMPSQSRDEKAMPSQIMYQVVLASFLRHNDAPSALAFVEEELEAIVAGRANPRFASFLLGKAIDMAMPLGPEQAYPYIITKFFRKFILDQEINVEVGTWRNILKACLEPPCGHEAFAMKSAIIAMTELRKSKKAADRVAYSLFTSIIRRNLDGKNNIGLRRHIAAAAFETCCKDGCLSNSLKEKFQFLLGEDKWAELYTSNLIDEKTEPQTWTANLGKSRGGKANRRTKRNKVPIVEK